MRAMTDYKRTSRLHTVAVWLSLTAGMLVGCDNETLIEGQEVAASADGSADADSAPGQSDSEADGQMDVLVGTDASVTTDLAVGTDAEDNEAGSDADPADGDAQNPDGTDTTSSDVAGSDTADGGPIGSDIASAGSDATPDQMAPDGGTMDSDVGATTDALSEPDAGTDAGGPAATDVVQTGSDVQVNDLTGSSDGAADTLATGTDAVADTVAPGSDAAVQGSGDADTAADSTGDAVQLSDSTADPDTGVNPDSSADPDTSTDADGAGSDIAAPVVCTTDTPCLPLGQVCDPLAKLCVDCLWDDDCGVLAQCIDRQCVPVMPCQNSLSCLTAVGASGEPLPICDAKQGLCVACLTGPDCGDGFECQDQACVAVTACQNSIVCGADAVCDTELGQCVQCLSPADCGASEVCEAGKCVDYLACSSDKQCTPKGMLCDTTKGKCASCLKNTDCPAVYHCAATGVSGTGQCVLDVCQQGESQCDANQVASCNAVGDGWSTPVACPPQTTCTANGGVASCTPWVCQPGPGCSDGKAIVCSADGLAVESSIDCVSTGGVCDNAQCKTPICTAGTTWCDGAALQTCSANGLTVTSSTPCPGGSHCTPAGCALNVCTPNQPTCSGNTAGVCNDVGSGLLAGATPCGELLCVQGECKALLCVPSTTVCSGNVRQTCSADGLSIAASNPCAGDEYCSNGSCLPQVCTPNAPLCNGQAAQVCNSVGSGYVGAGTACNPSTEVCKAGSCVPKICTPGSQFCDGEVLKTCSADGTQVTASTPCGSGSYCGATPQATAACLPTVCTPNAVGCSGLFITTCNTNGSGWLAGGTDCSLTSQVCSAGQCKSLACDPETPLFCDGNVVKACSTDGLTVSTFDACSSSEYCAAAACQAQVCSPGAAGCLGNQPAICNDTGSGQTANGAVCGAGKSCQAGNCVNCVPTGAELCDGSDNDCDGQTDETDAAPLCDDDNDCTSDSCSTAGSCQYVPVAAGKPCGDDAACLVDRVCSAGGVCSAGASRYFDKVYTPVADSTSNFYRAARFANGDLAVVGYAGSNFRLYRMNRAGEIVWQTSFAMTGYNTSITVDDLGGIYLGRSTGVTKFDASGVFQWGYETDHQPAVLARPTGGAFVLVRTEKFKGCGSCSGFNQCDDDLGHNLALIRLSASGAVQATVPLDSLLADGDKFSLDPKEMIWSADGNLVVLLSKENYCNYGGTSLLMKLSPAGGVLYSTDQISPIRKLIANGDGYVVLLSSSYRRLDKAFATTGSKAVVAHDIAAAPDGDVYTATQSQVTTPKGSMNIWTVNRYSPGGALRWSKALDYSAQGSSYVQHFRADEHGVTITGVRDVSELSRSWLVNMDGWGHTSCSGSGDCWQTAVTACDACSAELCDGLDNDCNGATDELTCEDENPCSTATCNGSSCVAAAQNGVACQDGNACTTGDLCQGGACQPGQNGTCDDNNPCTADSCTLQAGCLHAPVDGCTAPVCVAGAGGCFGTQPTVCNLAGSAYVASGPTCAAGTVCAAGACVTCVPSGVEVCDGKDNNCDGQIDEAGSTPLCDDDNACTTDTCATSGSCQFVAVAAGQPCSDAASCTIGQTCSADGVCQGGGSRYFERIYPQSTAQNGSFGSVARLPGGDLVLLATNGWLVRLNVQGEVVWQAATTSLTAVHSLAVDDLGGIYVAANTNVRKYNDSGVVQWTYTTTKRPAIAADPAGGVYVLVRTQSIQGCGVCAGSSGTKCLTDMGHQLALIRLTAAGAEQSNVAVDVMPVVTSVVKLEPQKMLWTTDGHLAVSLTSSDHCGTTSTALIKMSSGGTVLQWKEKVGGYAQFVQSGDGFGLLFFDKFEQRDKDLTLTKTLTLAAGYVAVSAEGNLYTATQSDVVNVNGTKKILTVRNLAPDGAVRWSMVFDYSAQGHTIAGALYADSRGLAIGGYRVISAVDQSWAVQMDPWGNTSCEASGDCWETPQTACSTCAAETCDSVDNDCDGSIDEQTCADTSPCIDNSCNGSSCVKTVKNKVACQDGDPCTADDTCQGGYCTSGPAWNCDDNDPCTADSCSTATGCQYAPVTGPGCGG